MNRNIRFVGLLFLVALRCFGQHSIPVACDHWKIEWRNPDGKIWGVSMADTKAGVIADRDSSIRFEQSYAQELKIAFDPRFADPSAPICVPPAHSTKSNKDISQETGDAIWQNNAGLMLQFWGGKMKDAIKQYLQASELFPSHPLAWMGASDSSDESSVGDTFKEYSDLLKETHQRVQDLQSLLTRVSHSGNDVSNEIARSTVQLEDSGYKLALTYYSLPAQVRSVYLPEIYVPMKDTATNEQLNTLCEQDNLRACADLWAQGVDVNFDQKIDEVKRKQQHAAEERKRQIAAQQEAERRRQLEDRALQMLDERTKNAEDEARQTAQNTYTPPSSYDPVAQETQMESQPSFADRLLNAWNMDNPIQDTLNQQLQRIREISQATQSNRHRPTSTTPGQSNNPGLSSDISKGCWDSVHERIIPGSENWKACPAL